MKDVSIIELSWLPELVPRYFQSAATRAQATGGHFAPDLRRRYGGTAVAERLSQPKHAQIAPRRPEEGSNEDTEPLTGERRRKRRKVSEADKLLPSKLWGAIGGAGGKKIR